MASDLMACQTELLQLEAEVRALQAGHFRDGDEEDWSSDDDDDDDDDEEEGWAPAPAPAKAVPSSSSGASAAGAAESKVSESKDNDENSGSNGEAAAAAAAAVAVASAPSARRRVDRQAAGEEGNGRRGRTSRQRWPPSAAETKHEPLEWRSKRHDNDEERGSKGGKSRSGKRRGSKKGGGRRGSRRASRVREQHQRRAWEESSRRQPTLDRKVGEADIKNFMNLSSGYRGGRATARAREAAGARRGRGHLNDRAFLNGGTGAEGLLLGPSGRKVSA